MGACCSTPVADATTTHSSKVAPKTENSTNAATHKSKDVSVNGAAQSAPSKPDANQAQAQAQAQAKAVRQRQMQKRIAVAAEAITSASDVDVPNVPKTDASRQLIDEAMAGNLLFQGLSLGARQAIASSMTSLTVTKGEAVIQQGDADANKYYVVDRGTFEVFIRDEKEEDGQEKMVKTCQPGR